MPMLASASSKTEERAETFLREFAHDVRTGLQKPSQKELHSKYLYDELGTALFQAITVLPEYGLTRADTRLLRNYSSEIVRAIRAPARVAELGSGNGTKTRHILRALLPLQSFVAYYPIDLSGAALAGCESELSDVAEVHPVLDSYLDGLLQAVGARQPGESLLVLFLGSTIGNFERRCAEAFLQDLRRPLLRGDAVLIGADLVKSKDRMLLAYDDPTGVTAAFDLNLLGRINRELGGNFDMRRFEHVAIYNESERRIEMHLRSAADQTVEIPGAGCIVQIRRGETIWTESSHKYSTDELPSLALKTGFRVCNQWIDEEWPFAESLWVAE